MALLQTYQPDNCCGSYLSTALLSGKLECVGSWHCPVCEQEWRAEVFQLDMGEGVRYWSPHSPVLIFRP